MTVYALLTEKQTFLDANSVELTGGQLFVYLAGTTTKATSYTETDGVTPNSNPVVLNSRGEVPNGLYVAGGLAYKLVLAPATDTDPPTSPIWTRDNISPINDVTAASVSEWQSSGVTATQINATTFSVAGDWRTTFQVGRRLKLTVTAAPSTSWGTVLTSTFSLGVTTVVCSMLTTSLDAGLTGTTPLVSILEATNPSLPQYIDYTFDDATVQGTLTAASGTWTTTGVTLTSTLSNAPIISAANNVNDAVGSQIIQYKSRAVGTTSSNDNLGTQQAFGYAGAAYRRAGYTDWTQLGAAGATWVAGQWKLSCTDTSGVETVVLSATAATFDIAIGSGTLRMGGGITRFESSLQTLAATNSNLSIAHGGPRKPDIVRAVIRKNATAGAGVDASYATGDEVDVTFNYAAGTDTCSTWSNATNVGWNNATSVPTIAYKAANNQGTVNTASWGVVLYCIWL